MNAGMTSDRLIVILLYLRWMRHDLRSAGDVGHEDRAAALLVGLGDDFLQNLHAVNKFA